MRKKSYWLSSNPWNPPRPRRRTDRPVPTRRCPTRRLRTRRHVSSEADCDSGCAGTVRRRIRAEQSLRRFPPRSSVSSSSSSFPPAVSRGWFVASSGPEFGFRPGFLRAVSGSPFGFKTGKSVSPDLRSGPLSRLSFIQSASPAIRLAFTWLQVHHPPRSCLVSGSPSASLSPGFRFSIRLAFAGFRFVLRFAPLRFRRVRFGPDFRLAA